MGQAWQLQEAKNKFSKLVEKAQNQGPQFVTKHGKETVVILSVEEYRRLVEPESNLLQFVERSPLRGVSIDLKRDKSPAREIEL